MFYLRFLVIVNGFLLKTEDFMLLLSISSREAGAASKSVVLELLKCKKSFGRVRDV